jgi:hypothetical protein
MGIPRNPAIGPLMKYLSRLRFPHLFVVTVGLFILNIIVPDVIPFADEILLGLVALLLGSIRKKKTPNVTDVTPE